MNSFLFDKLYNAINKINRNILGHCYNKGGSRGFKFNRKNISLSSKCWTFKKYEFRKLKASIIWNSEPPYKYANKRFIMDFL